MTPPSSIKPHVLAARLQAAGGRGEPKPKDEAIRIKALAIALALALTPVPSLAQDFEALLDAAETDGTHQAILEAALAEYVNRANQ